LKDLGYDLELESQSDIYSFCGIKFDTVSNRIHLSQKGLIDKVITYTSMANAEGKDTPAATNPLGSDKVVKPSLKNGIIQLLSACCYIFHPILALTFSWCCVMA